MIEFFSISAQLIIPLSRSESDSRVDAQIMIHSATYCNIVTGLAWDVDGDSDWPLDERQVSARR